MRDLTRLLIVIIFAFIFFVSIFQPKTSKGDVVSETASFGFEDFNGPFPALQFAQFDPKLGTLQAVEVVVSGIIGNTFTLQHASVVVSESLSIPVFFKIAPAPFTVDVNGAYYFYDSKTVSETTADWIGTGVVSFKVEGSAFSIASFPNGNGSAVVTSKAEASGVATFTYEAVPEPAEWSLCVVILIIYGIAAGKLRKIF